MLTVGVFACMERMLIIVGAATHLNWCHSVSDTLAIVSLWTNNTLWGLVWREKCGNRDTKRDVEWIFRCGTESAVKLTFSLFFSLTFWSFS